MADNMSGIEFDINIDDNNCIRILSQDKYAVSEKLKSESTKFVSSKIIMNKKLLTLINK